MQDSSDFKCPAMQKVMERINSVASSDLSILLCGETGAGKNRIAVYTHRISSRKEHPFVILDCARMNPNLVESELFGHEKGAFTGATTKKIGLFEMADRGTLFLNEIQNLSLEIQAKLLDVLERGIFSRVGGTTYLQSDFRLISASNENIPELIRAGQFRLDLYYRINEMTITLPPLRERREDILCIAEGFVKKFSRANDKTARLSPEAKRLLLTYPWPGNVRELRNVIHQAVVLCEGTELTRDDFPTELRLAAQMEQAKQEQWSLKRIEREHIATILDKTQGNLSAAQKILDIGYSTLVRKIKMYNLKNNESVEVL